MPASENVYTIEDLVRWDKPGHWLAVLGQPIKHSLSPTMHNAALASLVPEAPKLADWHYIKCEIAPEQLPEALTLLHKAGFLGVNLTAPHKVIALDCVESVDPAAAPAGAVNTLVRTDTGWTGHNTDGYGMSAAIREDLGIGLSGAHVLLLGAGGAARGAAVQCLQEGVASLCIANRSSGNLSPLISDLSSLPSAGNLVRGCLFSEIYKQLLPKPYIVINATSSGLKGDEAPPVELTRLPLPAAVYEMIYNPPRTALLQAAYQLGVPSANGLSMLVHQGAKALSLWTGIAAARLAPVMGSAARAALGR